MSGATPSLAQPTAVPNATPAMQASPEMTPQPAPSPPAAPTMPPMDFGNPPSGEIPILFNDHHVYANPDTLRQGRVLAALVKKGTIMVPLRSMFEQMGATVSYDAASKSVKASKPGSEVQVTLGKNQVVINGEARPLDVPPMMYKGVLLVPVRVISEALGAYVQWVPEQRVCVVRFIPPTPVPTPPPPIATPAPSPTPTPTPAPIGFIQGGIASTLTSNQYAPGMHSTGSWNGEAGLFLGPVSLVGTYRTDQYRTTHNAQDPSGNALTQFNTIDTGTAFSPVFTGRQWDIEGRAEYEILKPRINIGGSFLTTYTNYGDPRLTGGGFGIEKLPYGKTTFDWYGSFFYYPWMQGTYMETAGPNNGTSYKQQAQILKYDVGVNYGFGWIYVLAGYSGDRYTAKQNMPISQTHSGPYAGLGFRF
ncbi:MAG: copper amine oxidase N-terminal domain-containing protein [Candidatus Eremiobacteraeota bacterium]|nr:copper amine oxidase N-terminal domain-containing protein [Candidatus Eremiobacteraeota bacterium]